MFFSSSQWYDLQWFFQENIGHGALPFFFPKQPLENDEAPYTASPSIPYWKVRFRSPPKRTHVKGTDYWHVSLELEVFHETIEADFTFTTGPDSGATDEEATTPGPQLLDTYTGASAAYSLRLLREAYYGNPAITLRRSSDDAEQAFGFTIAGLLDTAAVAAFIGGGSGFIKTWHDQSLAGGNDVTQTTTAQQPLYVPSTFLSKPALLFDGSNDNMGRTANFNPIFPSNGQCCAFLIMNHDSSQAGSELGFGWQNTGAASRISAHLAWSDNNLYWDVGDFGGSGRLQIAQPGNWDNIAHIVELYRNSSDSQGIVVDGSSLSTATKTADPSSDASGRFFIGGDASTPHKGYFSEVIIFNPDIGSTLRTAVRTALNSYYGVF
jgi:hypothetical protein